jgi:hypothetical protein
MAFHNHPNLPNNSKATALGIPPHDCITYEYTNSLLTRAMYYSGGQEELGTVVADVVYEYDSNGNMTGTYRQDRNILSSPQSQNVGLESTETGSNPSLFDV